MGWGSTVGAGRGYACRTAAALLGANICNHEGQARAWAFTQEAVVLPPPKLPLLRLGNG